MLKSFAHWRRQLPPLSTGVRSLVVKHIVFFIAIQLLVVVPIASTYLHSVGRLLTDRLAAQLVVVGERGSALLDPSAVAAIGTPADAATPAYAQVRTTLQRIQADFDVDNAVLYRRLADGTYAYIADGSGNFAIGERVALHDRFPATLRAANRAWNSGELGQTDLFASGDTQWFQINVPLKAQGRVVALLLINKFATPVDEEIRRHRHKIVVGVSLATLLGVLLWGSFTFWSLRPLRRLRDAATAISSGRLDVDIPPLHTCDEVGLLNTSFRAMVAELNRSRSALEGKNAELARTVARMQLMEDLERSLLKLVPRAVRHALRSDPAALERGKREADVTVLFLDIEGSSLLAESMDPEQLDHLIENYFSHFLDCIYEHQGDVTETAGDGLMILFQGDDPAAHALNAVRSAAAIQRVAQTLRAEGAGGEGLYINVGVSSGPALVGFSRFESVGGSRVVFTAAGRTTIIAARLQHLAHGGSVLVSAETARRVSSHPDLRDQGVKLKDQGAAQLKNLHYDEPVYRLDGADEPPAEAGTCNTAA